MSKWSSFEKQQLLTESWREYLNEEEYSFLNESEQYVLTEQDLQEIFGKRAWEKLVDDFAKEDEGAAQLATRLGLKRADVTGPGGKALDIAQIEKKVKDLLDITKKANDPELTKATQDLVQNVKQTVKAGGDEQAADAAIKDDPTPVEVEEEFPIEITTKNFANFIKRSNFSKIAPLFKKVGVDKNAEEIKQMISKNLPAFFKSFEKLVDRSDVGDYFQLQAGLSETINIKDRIGVGSDPVSNLMIFVFGSLLRNYIRELSKTFENVPEEKAQQLVNSVAGLTNLTLKSIIDSKPKSQKAAEEPTTDREPAFGSDSDTDLSKVFPPDDDKTEKPAAASSPSEPESKPEPPAEPEEEKADETPEAEPEATAEPKEEEPEQAPEAIPEPEAPEEEETDETPEGVVTSILKGRGVDDEDIEAFLKDLKELKALEEVSQKDAAEALGIDVKKYKELMEKHPRVLAAIQKTRQKEAKEKLLNALAKIVAEKAAPSEADPTAAETEPKPEKGASKVQAKNASKKNTRPSKKEKQAAAKEPEQTPDLRFTRIAVRKIKNKYNNLTIRDKLDFNKLKETIEKIPQVESVEKQTFRKNSLFVVTLTNGEQFGLPKELQRNKLKFAFKEDEEASNPKAPVLDKVIKLAKIKGGKIEEKGIVKYGDALNESVMLRWKTIAGIK